MKVKQITFSHPTEGVITVHGSVPEKKNEMIGHEAGFYDNPPPYFHAAVIANGDGAFVIHGIKAIKSEPVFVGYKFYKSAFTSKDEPKYIDIIMNKPVDFLDQLVVYPSAIHSVTYE
jgi:hypothetical protein